MPKVKSKPIVSGPVLILTEDLRTALRKCFYNGVGDMGCCGFYGADVPSQGQKISYNATEHTADCLMRKYADLVGDLED